MARFLQRLGAFCARNRFAVVIFWVAIIIATAVGAATLSGKTVNAFSIPGQESTTALDLLKERFGDASAGATAQMVVQAPAGKTMQDPAVAASVQAVVAELQGVDGVASVTNPLNPAMPVVSQDMTTATINTTFAVEQPQIKETQVDALFDATQHARDKGLTAELTGDATQTRTEPGALGELIGVGIALLVLLVTFRSLTAAGLNLATALVGVAIGMLSITIATGFLELQSSTPILASMLGLAVGVDYALFIVMRFRQQLMAGDNIERAAATSVATAGSAVVTAGLTVVIALAGLSLAGIPFLTAMGLAAAFTIVIAVLVAITLVPATLAIVGRRSLRRADRNKVETVEEHKNPAFVVRWSDLVTKHRWIVMTTMVALLGLIAIPTASLKTSLTPRPDDNSTSQRAQNMLAEKFTPGMAGPLLILVDGKGATERANGIAQQAMTLPETAYVTPPQHRPDDIASLVTVIPKYGPDSEKTQQLVKELRNQLRNGDGPRAYVTGATAINVDASKKLADALPIYLAVVVGLAFVLLVLVFRSILVPLVAVLGFLLTIGASFGAMVAIFQWGWLRDIVQPSSTGPVLSLAPIIIVGILFGLAMDYQVFLVSRMHEAFVHGTQAREAVRVGFRNAGVVVLAAATIMFAVFFGFVPEGDAVIKTIALTLALGIFFDAIIVRMLIVPAALAIMNRTAWAFPSWLSWLPTLEVEGAALERDRV